MLCIHLFIVILFVAVYAKHEVYAGWKSYFIRPQTQQQLQVLGQLNVDFEVDVLSHPIIQREGVVLVQPQYQDGYLEALQENAIPFTLHSLDVKKSLEEEDKLIELRKQESRLKHAGNNLPYDVYQEYPVIDAYLQDIAVRYPNRVTLVTPAHSFEGRPIRYLKISTTNFTDYSKPVIFIDGGIHAREWISPPVVTWAIHKLVENVTENDLLEKFDWIFLPVVNPDGYQFTHTDSRFWRKTRSTNPTQPISYFCPGVDGNRNYDFFWNTVGTSNNPCSDTYAGSKAFSEIETQVVRNIIIENLERIALYLTMHSYGSMILYPWGHNGTVSQNSVNLQVVGDAIGDAIEAESLSFFPSYEVGNSVAVIGYAAAGAAEDFAHYLGVPLAYTCELPGLSGGLNGFHLDPIYIQQVVKETWAGIAAGARKVEEMYKL